MFSREPVFQSGDPVRIWQKFCGFLDLSLQEFMEIQEGLLMEQIELVVDSPLGKKIMNGQKPRSLAEFRRLVPLTTYEEYASYIGDCQEDALAITPEEWVRTSGRGGQFKWVPYSKRALEKFADATLTDIILAVTDQKGEVKIREGSRFLFIPAPRPYFSGICGWLFTERYGLRVIPPPELSERLSFQERIATGFKMALRSGLDYIGAVGTVLVKTGERFAERSQGMSLSPSLLHPLVLFRLLRALLRSKMQRRAMLPKDLWPIKGLGCGGTDADILREKLEYFWGKIPHETYVSTEGGVMGMQSWVKKGLMFYPYLNFFEFIPEEEWLKTQENNEYQPATVLLDEVEVGKIYEVVITNFYGMPLLRYRLGDLVKIIASEEKETGIKLPQFTFHSRADGLIDLYSIVRLDEKTVWQALANTNVSYEEWLARKEYEEDWPVLHLYIEPKQDIKADVLQHLFHEHLRAISPLYEEVIGEAETNPLRVTLLPRGSFQRYYEEKQKAGADLGHLKPPHMCASDAVIADLLRCGGGAN
ncbi:hypothetical protein ES703_27625 [subsurface metagenome]